jgi:hypothetical protein
MAITEADKTAFQQFAARVVSDAALREQFARDPNGALGAQRVALSEDARKAIISNADLAKKLVENMDAVHSAFFFYSKSV